ncbi:enhancer of polycomb-like-domain-containing protein [Scheffersomyces amazonensis]|uniref:enhancer of polycomb-like-domain-containing protein n=1 Tax=Scheffersomyces amazonensis TaxID=1078765 RepID=UPI00315C6CB8
MAILPAKNSGNAKQHASGARFRQRKISVKQPLSIYKQKDIPANDINNELEPSQVNHLSASGAQQQRDLHSIETGVDKNEEDEVHLQQVINAAQRALMGSKSEENSKSSSSNKKDSSSTNETNDSLPSVYIPTPDASKIWPEAHKYYNDNFFQEPESYIKFSATVEDTIGVEYNMDEIDEKFINEILDKEYPKPPAINKKSKNTEENLRKCSELEFEIICDKLEKTIEERQPFLSMDPTNILSYEELSSYIIDEYNNSTKLNNPYVQSSGGNIKYISTTVLKERLSKELKYEPFVTIFDKNNGNSSIKEPRSIPKLFALFGKPIYEHWKSRKIERKGKSINPMLKFEDPNANEKDNDNDPYVCFRRREFRQARKTRRADTLGAERIRLLQKSLYKARSLILGVAQREILKLQNFEVENSIFKLRSEGKNLKRIVGVKGDDYLYYPHKRKKIIKPKEEEEEIRENAKKKLDNKRRLDSRESSSSAMPGTATIGTNAVNKDKNGNIQPQASHANETAPSSTQPYVKLPPSKIPDMELVTVSLVLKEKNETIKRAVLDKLRKRKEQDKGYVNFTDDPHEPSFNISTNDNVKESKHIPYSSIAAANLHQINTSNYISENLKKLLEESKKPLPGVKTFRGSNGELIPSKAFPHISSLLQDKINNSKFNNMSYIAQLLNNIDSNNFSAYNSGYAHQFKKSNPHEFDEEANLSEPIFRIRKRLNRVGQMFVDRRGLIQRPDDEIDSFLNFDDTEDNDKDEDKDVEMKDSEESESPTNSSSILNVYDSKIDTIKRLDSNWKFDNDLSEGQRGILDPFSMDPSKLNSISDDTQSIRFGSMLLSKSYGLLREAVQQRQQAYIQQAKMRALQQQQLANRLQQQQLQQQQQQQQQQIQQLQQQQQQQSSSPQAVSVSQTPRSNGDFVNSQRSSMAGSPKVQHKAANSPPQKSQ